LYTCSVSSAFFIPAYPCSKEVKFEIRVRKIRLKPTLLPLSAMCRQIAQSVAPRCKLDQKTSRNRFRCPNHQPGNRDAGLHPQFGVGDLRLQFHDCKYSFDVGAGVTVASVELEAVVEIRLASDRLLEREH
jgi:hypothetical protein